MQGKSFDRRRPLTQDKGMKRLKLVLALAVIISVAFPVFAEPPQPCVFIHGGLRVPVEKEIGKAIESGFGFSVALSGSTRIVVNLGTARHSIISREGGNKVFYKSFSASPFLAGLQQELIGGVRLSAYVAVQGGILFSGLQDLNIVTVPETTVRQTIPASLTLRGAAGVELSLSANFHLFGEAGYSYGRATGTTSYYDFSTLVMEQEFSLDLSAVDISMGLKYYF